MKKTINKAITAFSLVVMTMILFIPDFNYIDYTASAYEYVSRGIDVSHHNGEINWNTVANSNVDFAIIRAGSTDVDGEALYKDSKFETNYSGAINAGIKVGAYYYCGAYTKEGFERNAYDFLNLLNGKSFDLPVYIYIERTSKQKALGKSTLTTYVLSALDIINEAGYHAGIYANRDWFKNYLDESRIRDSGYDIWWAQYPSGTYAVDPSKYDKSSVCGIWQYSSLGSINGIGTNVDVNVAYKEYDYNTTLTAPKVNVSVNGNITSISWNKVKNATHYDLRLYFADGRSLYNNWGGNPDETELSFKMDPGDYKVQVYSADDNGNLVYCNPVWFTIESEPLVAPQINVSVNSQIATISWDKVNSATHYDLKLYYADGRLLYNNWGRSADELSLSFKMDPGDYKVQVCSAYNNGNFVYCNPVYYSSNNSDKPFEEYSSVSVSEGIYYFSPKCAPNSCIDSEGGETLYFMMITIIIFIFGNISSSELSMPVKKTEKASNYIKNTLTNQYLLMYKENNVTESQYKVSLAKWYFIDCGNGYYKIINYFHDLAIDVYGAGSGNGTNVWCYDPSDMSNSAQLFKLNSVNQVYLIGLK
ncbi:MAG: hypothetical protein K2N71_02120 [Oscillospiraceae bacterium]|nr:hypothetical protein [Oscillospiraceae bacterium]